MTKIFTIAPDHVGWRLDIFLHKNLPDLSRSRLQKLIKDGMVLLNHKKVTPHHFLKEGDTITLSSRSERSEERDPDVHATPSVIAETPDYLILDKPAGMVVHPALSSSRTHRGIPTHHAFTLVDWLLQWYPPIRIIGDDPLRPGIVHRLDKDASGVMVVARTQDSFESLIRQFKLRQIKKEYLVLVTGRVTPTEGVIDLPIGRSKKDYTKRAAHPLSVIPSEAKPSRGTAPRSAVTHYEVLEQFKHAALVRVVPETGRTHQIRVHFFAKGNPVIGDSLYTSSRAQTRHPERSEGFRCLQSKRLMLYATMLSFRDLSGAWQEYVVAPDEEFQKIITQSRNS